MHIIPVFILLSTTLLQPTNAWSIFRPPSVPIAPRPNPIPDPISGPDPVPPKPADRPDLTDVPVPDVPSDNENNNNDDGIDFITTKSTTSAGAGSATETTSTTGAPESSMELIRIGTGYLTDWVPIATTTAATGTGADGSQGGAKAPMASGAAGRIRDVVVQDNGLGRLGLGGYVFGGLMLAVP